ncbi:hypothetical protein BU25DRAFT_71342 [Macroventuria anomochaeta]|uniref:Uncharacterized protein n=1 Tax=Macroventuria anomochaeta TaxID=301207 RepID=A0ACB6S1F8_9PLEO|nr:uncharacterized protein BU25DRAFT_71342 [Macroventuria anomochaeta]KAF2627224.1 hypothetical protein BU25DRAFT_71342 [Macroventuria anomochaeta]
MTLARRVCAPALPCPSAHPKSTTAGETTHDQLIRFRRVTEVTEMPPVEMRLKRGSKSGRCVLLRAVFATPRRCGALHRVMTCH